MDTFLQPAARDTITHTRAPIWLTATAAAILLHAAALAYAWLATQPADDDAAIGAPAIEIGLELAAADAEESNLPPGPEADDATASAASTQQTAKAEETDLPKEQPTETDEPDRLVSPEKAREPEQKTPDIAETKAEKTSDSVASEATAPAKIETARESARSIAPVLGSGVSTDLIRKDWQRHLIAHLNRFKRYPRDGRLRSVEVVVGFTLDRFGHVVAMDVQSGAGDAAFDRAAREMMKRADPVPPPPPLVADEGLTFVLPVVFHEKRR